MEDRIIELETKLAYQEDMLETLNQIVTHQQDELTTLRLALQKLHQQIQQMPPTNLANTEQETPPHY